MTRFSARTESEAVVAAERDPIWAVLTDPVLLTQMTPFLEHVEADGDRWRWDLAKIRSWASRSRHFTEQMTFEPMTRITFTHAPPPGPAERAGVDGWYTLDQVDGGTLLRSR